MSKVAEQFDNPLQQRQAAELGLWIFLTTEVLFFGGLFAAFTLYLHTYPEGFERASRELNLKWGTLNTAILLTSSLTMALAVHMAELGKKGKTATLLLLTAGLGSAFMLVKGFEYAEDFKKNLIPGRLTLDVPDKGPLDLFYMLYYVMTGVHAIHLTIGIGLTFWMAIKAARNHFEKEYFTPVELTGLYWHFVDLIWVFLYPLLYLLGRQL